ncbi:hypothetical protein [Streptomyces niveus]|uniref:hypothetical protein n=1 Tax=Streptomyces niveus TaxID=193462 RepID=UPI00367D86F1
MIAAGVLVLVVVGTVYVTAGALPALLLLAAAGVLAVTAALFLLLLLAVAGAYARWRARPLAPLTRVAACRVAVRLWISSRTAAHPVPGARVRPETPPLVHRYRYRKDPL